MDSLLLHAATRRELDALRNEPPHALLFVGPPGFGKRTAATRWAQALSSHIEIMEPDEKGTITIENIRTLYRRTRSRQESHQTVIVDHAEAMGIEAQNAFLKLLEEPRAGVTFILTAPSNDSLLPTIASRVQTVQFLPLSNSILQAWLTKQKAVDDAQNIAQLLFVAQGRPATLARLMHDKEGFAHYRDLMQTAKKLLGAPLYERLATLPSLVKDKESLIAILEAMAHMVKLQIGRNPTPTWYALADGLQVCLARLAQNGNPRAQLMALFMLY